MKKNTVYKYNGKYRDGKIDNRKTMEGQSGVCRILEWTNADKFVNNKIINVPVAVVVDINSNKIFTVFPEQLELAMSTEPDYSNATK